jgi:hypothetical protein
LVVLFIQKLNNKELTNLAAGVLKRPAMETSQDRV